MGKSKEEQRAKYREQQKENDDKVGVVRNEDGTIKITAGYKTPYSKKLASWRYKQKNFKIILGLNTNK